MKNYMEILGLILTIIGAVSSIWFIYEKYSSIKRLSWRQAENKAKDIAQNIFHNGYNPTLILGIGRGGAIMGSLISYKLRQQHLIVIDRKYDWIEGCRKDDMILRVEFPASFIERVLLVAGEAHTGGTMQLYKDYLKNKGAREIRTAVFYLQEGCTQKIDYYGIKGSKFKLMPWQDKTYLRDSRSKEEADLLLANSNISMSSGAESRTLIYLIRHAESTDNSAEDIFSGISNPQLTDVGNKQAEATGRFLTTDNIQRIYTSPLKRAIETARVIQNRAGGTLVIDDRLREIDYGEWDGLPRSTIKLKWPELYDNFVKDPIINMPPHSENPNNVLIRMLKFWEDLHYAISTEGISRIAIVTHKTVVRLFISHIQKLELTKYREKQMDNCSITKIILDKNGTFIDYENRVDHLRNI